MPYRPLHGEDRSETYAGRVLPRVVGRHPSMRAMAKIVSQVAPTRATVLITGETGTGKELVAEAVHLLSPRGDGPLVRLNCSALNEQLLESELFGHERGAFTGAFQRREGRFQQAHGGTLYLDEISEIPWGLQVKLLRFLQDRRFERVGSNETLSVDVRVIVASNKDLAAEVASGRFREDLYYRTNVVSIRVPALRERRSDIPWLAQFFAKRFAEENDRKIEGLTPSAVERLMAARWPGNVRELENMIERAVVLSAEPWLGPEHLALPNGGGEEVRVPGSTLAAIERHAILKTLTAVGGDTAAAAEILGISRRKIQYRLREYRDDGADELPADPPSSPSRQEGAHALPNPS